MMSWMASNLTTLSCCRYSVKQDSLMLGSRAKFGRELAIKEIRGLCMLEEHQCRDSSLGDRLICWPCIVINSLMRCSKYLISVIEKLLKDFISIWTQLIIWLIIRQLSNWKIYLIGFLKARSTWGSWLVIVLRGWKLGKLHLSSLNLRLNDL